MRHLLIISALFILPIFIIANEAWYDKDQVVRYSDDLQRDARYFQSAVLGYPDCDRASRYARWIRDYSRRVNRYARQDKEQQAKSEFRRVEAEYGRLRMEVYSGPCDAHAYDFHRVRSSFTALKGAIR